MAACTASPDDAVRSCIERLRHRRDDIADALDGRALRVVVDFGEPLPPYRITFTREGHLMTRSGQVFDPHLEIHGPPRQMARFLGGETSLSSAILDGIVSLHVSSTEAAEWTRLRALVAEELAAGKVGAGHGV